MIAFLQNSWLALVLSAIVSYLFGSISFAVIVTRLLRHQDIRDFGSGNAGATNVLRSQGKLPALLTTIGDLLKSAAAVTFSGWAFADLQLAPPDGALTENLSLIGCYLGGFFCMLGHLYPVFFGFRGGKGVMSTAGMMLLLDWRATLLLLAIFIAVLLCSRMVSLGSVTVAALLAPVTYLFRTFLYHQDPSTVWFCTVVVGLMGIIIIIKHGSNIKRILNHTESKMW